MVDAMEWQNALAELLEWFDDGLADHLDSDPGLEIDLSAPVLLLAEPPAADSRVGLVVDMGGAIASAALVLAEPTSEPSPGPLVDFAMLIASLGITTDGPTSLQLLGTDRFNTAATASTYLITHGYQSSASETWLSTMGETIRALDPQANVLLVDWSRLADPPGLWGLDYARAADNTLEAGRHLAQTLALLPLTASGVQLIGHSLGAHLSGVAGDRYEDLTGRDFGAIVGMDPAGPGFESPDFFNGFDAPSLAERLDASDAAQVVAYHTSDTLGYDAPLGDLDVYVNPDDLLQPGQDSFVGNHSYAHSLYTQLLSGRSFLQPDGGSFGYGDQFSLTGVLSIETML